MRASTRYLVLAITLVLNSNAWAKADDPAQGVYFFEQPTAASITTTQGTLAQSTAHYKDGTHALRWDYQPRATLTIHRDIHVDIQDDITPTSFFLWLYNETAQKGELHFQFSEAGQPRSAFVVGLDFTGWRGIAIPYRDMQGKLTTHLNTLTVTAPDHTGRIYFDQLMLAVPLDNRWPVPDRLVPFVNPAVNTAANKHWNALLMYDRMLHSHYPKLNFAVNLDDGHGTDAALYRNAEQVLGLQTDAPITVQQIHDVLEAFSQFHIQEQSGVISGPPLEYPTHGGYRQVKGVFTDAQRQQLNGAHNDLRDIGKTMLECARLLRDSQLDAAARTTLTQQFLLTTRYLLDQGFTAGSGYQIIHHLGYQSRELFDAWFLGRHLLAAHHLLSSVAQTMLWYTNVGRIFTDEKTIVDANVDVLNTQLQWMIKSVLMLPDALQRDALLKQLSQWLSTTVLRSQGVGGGFKPDGSIFHHSQHYTAYAKDAFGGLAPSVYILSATPYALTHAAQQRLRDSLYKMWVYTKDTHIPLLLSGRHPTGVFSISPEPFKWLALAGSPEHNGHIDSELAAIFAALTGQKEWQGVAAAVEPSGAWAMNYAGMAIQRRLDKRTPSKSWLAIARGFSRYLVGNESYQRNNRYGRYLQYGSLEIIPSDSSKEGFHYDGWDWNRVPGSTTIHLPWAQLKARLNQLPAAGIEEMLLSTETYLGADTLGDNAMFAMKLHGHSKYGQGGFHARKSYFFFDNRVIALGTGIDSDDDEHPVETTLFQYGVTPNEVVQVNGESITTLGTERKLAHGGILRDPADNVWFVPDGNPVEFHYAEQHSLDGRNDQPTQGNFATAVISHGKAPKNAGYEYAVVIGAERDDQTPPQYTVLQRSNQLHAVRDQLSAQEDYAFFEPIKQDVGGIVLGVDAPNLVMALPIAGNKQLKLTVVNPDLAFYNGVEKDQVDAQGRQQEVSIYSRRWRRMPSQPQHSTTTIRGHWQLQSQSQCANLSVVGENTQVQVSSTDATPCRLTLTRVN